MTDSFNYFHTPDPIWETWGINTHEQFLDDFIVKGKFHTNVPESVVKEYEIVERLFCYSYYSYQLIDETFSKVTRIFEGAVNLRLDELNIKRENTRMSLKKR